ncbi:hypothetical protein PC116_g95 [Phytophthora cactorum]|uniref:Uncharacterized protein n=1 Tax=Phytophthora cactorum TaxID=29920 RepID=A0A8T1EQ03_9STRA|nr:hypothetical protein PC117_g1620 [Phytophthora cactorum]KAG3036407.1 hypothetical protein PC120_g169 [Phytophthora cactorum]KAG3040995.1 hypothetical protein PC119_g1065 [Phytophthora cactorum]KAG3193525.1 hypothetical protein C6341_g96 [Phytophthora cactorum]KAG4064603.1 hypothetical protein PC123_g648 [Phytophthora cactorum]
MLWLDGDLTCRIDGRDLVPDQCINPAGAAPGTLPNLIVEVAYKRESWALLVEKLKRWMGPGCASRYWSEDMLSSR